MSILQENTRHWGNRYIFLSGIGKGSFGTVYKVKDCKGPEGQESIKVLKEVNIDTMDQDQIEECTREGKLLSKLNHSSIVKFFDSFRLENNYCIITEYCEGGDLKLVIERTKRSGSHLEELRIIRWFIQVIEGLDYIHKRKILHRDLKPNNIFLKYDSVKIGDFGISRILNFTNDLASTFLGTPYYMSPEVLKHDGYNTASDIWSSGVILYEMCALKHAFKGDNLMRVMVTILESQCPEIPSHYSENLQGVLECILIKDPVKRPNASEILDLPFIKSKIRDPWIDIVENDDLSKTLVNNESEEISNFLSKSTVLDIITPTTVELTPKQKILLKKSLEADKKAEEQREYIEKTYKTNVENRRKLKQDQFQTSLPFTSQRNISSRSSISEYDELNSSRNSGFNTYTGITNVERENYNRLSKTEIIGKHFKLQPIQAFENKDEVDDITIRKTNFNQNGLFNATYKNLIYDDPSNYNVAPYNAVNDPDNREPNYEYAPDFESESSTSPNSVKEQNDDDEFQIDTKIFGIYWLLDVSAHPLSNFEVFQDNPETDPYGKNTKLKKINAMKKKCLEKVDEKTLEKAITYMKENWQKKDYIMKLLKICKSDDVAMTVDQLFFLMLPISEIY